MVYNVISTGVESSQVEEEIRKPKTGINKIKDKKQGRVSIKPELIKKKRDSKTDELLKDWDEEKKAKITSLQKTPKQTNYQG